MLSAIINDCYGGLARADNFEEAAGAGPARLAHLRMYSLSYRDYYGNKYIRVGRDSIEICKVHAGSMES